MSKFACSLSVKLQYKLGGNHVKIHTSPNDVICCLYISIFTRGL